MAAEDAEASLSAPDGQPEEKSPTRGKRQRAADLFSPHRYRELQVRAFERRAGKVPEAVKVAEIADDEIDPLLSSDSPAAEAARAHVEGISRRQPVEVLSPVDAGNEFDFPFDSSAVIDEDDAEGVEHNDESDAQDRNGDGLDGDLDEGVLGSGDTEATQSDESGAFDMETTQLENYPPAQISVLEDAVEPVGVSASPDDQQKPSGHVRRSSGRNMPWPPSWDWPCCSPPWAPRISINSRSRRCYISSLLAQ